MNDRLDTLPPYNSKVREDHDTDIRAMTHARTWSGVVSVALAMQGLDRWTAEAEEAFVETARKFGSHARDHEILRVIGTYLPISVSTSTEEP